METKEKKLIIRPMTIDDVDAVDELAFAALPEDVYKRQIKRMCQCTQLRNIKSI